MGKEVNEILKERGKVHGDWADNAIASANLYRAFTDIAIKTGNSGYATRDDRSHKNDFTQNRSYSIRRPV